MRYIRSCSIIMILIIRVNLMLQWVWPSVALLLLLLLLFCTTGIRKRAALLVPQIMLALLSSSDGRLFKNGCVEASEAKAICAAVAVVLCEAREALICGLRGELSGRIWFG